MSRPREFSDDQLITALAHNDGHFASAAKELGVVTSSVHYRAAMLGMPSRSAPLWNAAVRELTIENGNVVIFSDCHWHAGQPKSTANAALERIILEMQPKHIIGNGDLFDFSKISRHPSIGWERQPSVAEDLEHGKKRIRALEDVAPEDSEWWWDLGNHDIRFETHLAQQAPDYLGVRGFALKDHFSSRWTPAWRIDINPHLQQGGVIVKHRGQGSGKYAARNEAIKAGRNMVMGHLHAAQVFQVTNANGTFYGVDGGCVASTTDDCFVNYTETTPTDWRSSIVVLSFWNGQLLEPALCKVLDEEQRLTEFRGDVTKESL